MYRIIFEVEYFLVRALCKRIFLRLFPIFVNSKISTNWKYNKYSKFALFSKSAFKFNSNLDGRNFRISQRVYMVFPYIPVSHFSPIALLLYPSNVPPLFFTKTISSAALNLNASFRICLSLVCRFLNRYNVLFSFSSPLISTFSLTFAHEERDSFTVNRPYLKSSPFFISHTCRASFLSFFY